MAESSIGYIELAFSKNIAHANRVALAGNRRYLTSQQQRISDSLQDFRELGRGTRGGFANGRFNHNSGANSQRGRGSRGRGRGGLRCHGCNGEGHKINECPSANSK